MIMLPPIEQLGWNHIDIETSNGFLTPRDRRYLLGEKAYDNVQTERNVRQAIRDRIVTALYDFGIVAAELSQRDRELVFEQLPGQNPPLEAHIARNRAGVNMLSVAEQREYSLLRAMLLLHDFVGRGLTNTGRPLNHVGLFGVIQGIREKNRRDEPLTLADLWNVVVWLPSADGVLRREILEFLGLSDLEILFTDIRGQS